MYRGYKHDYTLGYYSIVSVVSCNADNSRRVVPVPILQGIVLIGGNNYVITISLLTT